MTSNSSPFKAVALDLDGTLLNTQHQMSPENISVLKALHHQGVKVIIASGRSTSTLLTACKALDFPFSFVSYNGSYLVEKEEGEWQPRLSIHINPNDVEKIIDLADQYGLFLNLYTDDGLVGYQKEGHYTRSEFYIQQTQSDYLEFTQDRTRLPKEGVIKLLAITSIEKRDFYFQKLEGTLKKSCHIFKSNPEYIEFTSLGVTKATGLKKWCEIHQTSIQQVVAMGDAENDLEMLRAVGKGIAVKNASPGLKKDFKTISDWTNNEFAVLRELNRLFSLGIKEPV